MGENKFNWVKMSAKVKMSKNKKKKLDKQKVKQTNKPKSQRPKAPKTGPKQYVKEVRLELTKVSWPSRQEVITFTGVVIVMVIIFGLYTFGLDITFQKLLQVSTEIVR